MIADKPALTEREVPNGVRPRSWSREEYHRMADAGIFRPDERLELIEGEVVEKVSPQKTPHSETLQDALEVLQATFGSGYRVRPQLPLVLSEKSEPEPDLAVVRRQPEETPRHKPAASEVVLVVEVSDATLTYDRAEKTAMYARYGVPEYWIINVRQQQLEVYREPEIDSATGIASYHHVRTYAKGQTVSPLERPETLVSVAALLPPTKP